MENATAMQIEKAWPEAVGPDIASHARPGSLCNGVLTVLVKSSVWLAELRREANATLLPKLRSVLDASAASPALKSLRVVLDTGGRTW